MRCHRHPHIEMRRWRLLCLPPCQSTRAVGGSDNEMKGVCVCVRARVFVCSEHIGLCSTHFLPPLPVHSVVLMSSHTHTHTPHPHTYPILPNIHTHPDPNHIPILPNTHTERERVHKFSTTHIHLFETQESGNVPILSLNKHIKLVPSFVSILIYL